MICWQRSTHSLQMKTLGPAINRSTWFCCLPQNEQRDVRVVLTRLCFRHIDCFPFSGQKHLHLYYTSHNRFRSRGFPEFTCSEYREPRKPVASREINGCAAQHSGQN